MRTQFLALLCGLSLVACAGQIDGTGGGGDDDVPPDDCGNLTVNQGEGCDDGNNTDGDGCSASCQIEATPRLDVSVDKPTVATELGTTHMITVTLTGSDGFGGQVTLAPSIVDAANAPLTAWTIALDQTTLTVPQNGTATAIATVTIPSQNKGLVGTAKFVATSSAGVGTFDASSAITALDQVTVMLNLDANGQCDYPPNSTIQLTMGTKIRWFNNEAAGGQRITIHVEGNGNGVDHQPDPGSAPQTAYEQIIGGSPGQAFNWYCHDPGPTVGGLNLQAVAP